jgi:hypothetical protein
MAEREAHILFVMASLNKERKERSALVISSDQQVMGPVPKNQNNTRWQVQH